MAAMDMSTIVRSYTRLVWIIVLLSATRFRRIHCERRKECFLPYIALYLSVKREIMDSYFLNRRLSVQRPFRGGLSTTTNVRCRQMISKCILVGTTRYITEFGIGRESVETCLNLSAHTGSVEQRVIVRCGPFNIEILLQVLSL